MAIGERTKDLRDEVVKMIEDGYSVPAICEALGTYRKYVYNVRNAYGLENNYNAPYEPQLPEHARVARNELERAWNAFERCTSVATYGEVIKARRAYDSALGLS